jgi:hypothetical protein
LPDRERNTPDEDREILRDDIQIERFLLDAVSNKRLDVDVSRSALDGEVVETMEGASNVQVIVHDPDGKLARSGIFHEPIPKGRYSPPVRKVDIKLDQVWFRLVGVNKAGLDLTLTFEDRDVNRMRQKRGPIKVARSKVTRAEFILRLTRAVKSGKIRFYAPELHKKQPIEGVSRADRKEIRDRRREGGINPDAQLTIKGVKATPYQLGNAETVLGTAARSNAGPKATKALVAACITESLMRNPKGGDGSSAGILQLDENKLKGSISMNGGRRDIELVCTIFLSEGYRGLGGAIELERKGVGDFADIAQDVQGSFDESGSNYRTWGEEADAIIDAYGSLSRRRLFRKYEFKVEKKENYWQAAVRLAEEVGWRLFMVRGWLYYIAEEDLIRSRPRLILDEDHPSVISIDWDIDEGKPVHTCTIQTRIYRWGVPPGTVVQLTKDMGPAQGRWLVSEIRRKLFSSEAEVRLKRAEHSKVEPAPELRPQEDAENLGGSAGVEAVYAMAQRISEKDMPYVWGGGHATAGKPTLGGYDCSGYTAACLLAGNMLPSEWESGVPASGTMATDYGKPGRGKEMTVWANSGHVYIEFSKKRDRADTSPHSGDRNGERGPHLRGALRSNAGFTPRHWPGT